MCFSEVATVLFEQLLASFQATLPLKEQEKVSEFTFSFDL